MSSTEGSGGCYHCTCIKLGKNITEKYTPMEKKLKKERGVIDSTFAVLKKNMSYKWNNLWNTHYKLKHTKMQ